MDLIHRFGPFAILLATLAALTVTTRRTSGGIGRKAYGFGKSRSQRLAQWLFRCSIAAALVVTGIHALGSETIAIWPLSPGEYNGPTFSLVGVIAAAAGAVLAVCAGSGMGRRWRVGVPEEAPDALVTTGLFRFSRNPVFLGMITVALGLTAAVPADLMVVAALAFWVACEMQVRDEEEFLLSAFGTEYRDYMARVRRWF